MPVPTQNIEWASSLQADPTSGQDNKAEPPAATKTYGYDFLETPPRQWVNWWRDAVKDWQQWLRGELDNPGVSGESGIGTAAGRDIGTAEHDVPDYGTAKDLDVNKINAAISHASDTTETSTIHTRQLNASTTCQVTQALSQINASDDCGILATCSQAQINCSDTIEIAPSTKANLQVNASIGACVVSGDRSQINVCEGACVASGNMSQVNASDGACIASGTRSQVNASSGTSEASGANSQVNASGGGCDVSGDQSQINASLTNCDLIGNQSQINAALTCAITADYSVISASQNCIIDGGYHGSVILASRFTKAGTGYAVTGGYGTTPAASSNRTWEIDSINGTGKCTTAWTGSWSPADFGEMFENLKQKIIPLGTIVCLSEDKIRPGTKDDRILGVVSATTAFLGNDSAFCWQGRYMKGDFGEAIYKEISDPDFKGAKKDAPKIKVRKENPKFDIERDNTPRSERKDEWTAVALLGQVNVRLKQNVKAGDYVAADGSKSTEQTRLECMKISKKFSQTKGYAIGLCLIR